MKKKRAVAGGLLLVLGIAQSVSAGTTTVTYHVDPSYMVLVPANTTIPFNEESVNYGKIRAELRTGWNKVKTSERRMYRLFFINILICRCLQLKM